MNDIHEKLLAHMHETYLVKNHDYGDSVHEIYQRYGMISFIVRMEDKLCRLRQLTLGDNNTMVSDEKIDDTIMDLANYAVLAEMELIRERTTIDGISTK